MQDFEHGSLDRLLSACTGLCLGTGLLLALLLAPGSVHGAFLTILSPLNNQLYPLDFAPPLFKWADNTASSSWSIDFRFKDGSRISKRSGHSFWRPSPEEWDAIKEKSLEQQAELTISGQLADQNLSTASVHFSTSSDPVGAPILYRLTPLPMVRAVKELSTIEWRLGDASSSLAPRTVLTNMWVCGNCHSSSSDGKFLAMDFDFMNDKGSYVITEIETVTTVDSKNLISWSDYQREDGQPTFGLLARISPDGRYCVSTVKDCSVFEFTNDFAYSQLFFPVRGILVVYDLDSGSFFSLPGADDPELVQSNPVWSPDGQWVYFCRAPVPEMVRNHPKALLRGEKAKPFVTGKQSFTFDIYRVPFNSGRGGKPQPVTGASLNGMSNFFPSFSPDGKWIVFCRAENFMLLRPDSSLWIMPTGGGEPRRLACNHDGLMNSWHSWSPNGKWLVFSSKANGPYTDLWLTHINDLGEASPPLLLENFSAPQMAANIPEFLNIDYEDFHNIEVAR